MDWINLSNTFVFDIWDRLCLSSGLATRIFWSFDNTLEDFYNNFNGIGSNSPAYLSPGYNGAGACLWLNKALNQSVTILSPPFLNLSYTSFTIEAWMYAQSLCDGSTCTDNVLFGQFTQNITDYALQILVRDQHTFFRFYNDEEYFSSFYLLTLADTISWWMVSLGKYLTTVNKPFDQLFEGIYLWLSIAYSIYLCEWLFRCIT